MNEFCIRNSEIIHSKTSDKNYIFSLNENEIHVWIAGLDQSFCRIKNIIQILSAEEQRRANQFHFEKDRRSFVARRALLRIILGNYLGKAPELLKFTYGKHGKLYLECHQNTSMIHFNVSHSGEICIFVFACRHEIGVDIEQIRVIPDRDLIAEHFFSKKENAVFRTLQENQKTEAFFDCWVRKEAFIKAKGIGLSYPLDSFEVTLTPGGPARFITTESDDKETSNWTMHEINPFSGYAGAIVVQN